MQTSFESNGQKRIIFVGWYGRGNCGDEAFKIVHQKLFPGWELIWADDKLDLEQYQRSSVFVLGGGDVISNFYVSRIPINSKFFIYGAGLAHAHEAKYIANFKDRLLGCWVRNESDVVSLKKYGVESRFTPDIVFQLNEEIKSTTQNFFSRNGRKIMMICPSNNGPEASVRNSNIKMHHYYEYMVIEMAEILDFVGKYYDLVFVPMSENPNDNDIIWIMRVLSKMNNKDNVLVIKNAPDPLSFGAMCVSADIVMSMKFHGLIFSMLARTPCINVGLTRKTQKLFSDNGFEHLSVEPFSFSKNKFLACLKAAETAEAKSLVYDASTTLQRLAVSEGSRFEQSVRSVIAV